MPDPLNKFTLQGEGGYQSYAYTFVDRGTCYFSAQEKNGYISDIISNQNLIKTLTLGSYTYYYVENILKIASGNANKVMIYQDGSIDIGGKRTKFPWIADNLYNFADIFCPSNYAAYYTQFFLMKTGELYEVNCNTKTKTLLLSDVNNILCRNPSHACDILVAKNNGEVWHAWLKNSGGNRNSGQASGVCQVVGLNVQDIYFSTIADNPWGAFICYSSDKRKLYRLTTDSVGRHTSVDPTPYITLTDPDEHYLHGQGNEFHTVVITNKKLYDYHDRGWNADYYDVHTYDFLNGVQISTPTAYSMMIEATDGYYFMDQTGAEQQNVTEREKYGLNAPIKYDFYNTLVTYLKAKRTL